MTEGKGEPVQLRCPRCGGAMRKPAGSTLYWHADTNHPRCDITNIVETVLEIAATPSPETPPEPPKTRGKRGK